MTKEIFLKVKDQNSLVRDTRSNAILNVDEVEYEKYRYMKNVRQRQNLEKQIQKDEINTLQQDVENIKSELFGMKDLLLQVLEKLNGRN